MARHRVGDSYLSDAEYNQHQIETWLAIVFVGGAALAGIVVHWACPGDWPKGIRFILIIGAAYGGGTLAAYLLRSARVIIHRFRISFILKWLPSRPPRFI